MGHYYLKALILAISVDPPNQLHLMLAKINTVTVL